jgi:hypothetical protein
MNNDKLSLETRVSSAFVQGQLEELVSAHTECAERQEPCDLVWELAQVLDDWKQAEAELAEARAELAANNEKESQ